MKQKHLLIILILLAFGLRVWQLDAIPPGWRDDELIEALILSHYARGGDWRVYYPDASGHEALYHALHGLVWWAVGANVFGVRYLSVIFGTLNVLLTYKVGRAMFGRAVGMVAAVGLAISFWGLMYSRMGLRHIAMPFFCLGAFYWLWRLLAGRAEEQRGGGAEVNPFISDSPTLPIPFLLPALGLALFMGLGFYTYFAARGVPLVVAAVVGYAAVVAWPRWRGRWTAVVIGCGLGLLLALPLVLSVRAQPGGDARVAELAAPIVQARAGDFSLLGEHIWRTLAMFHADGDDEYLYNIPYRPVFGAAGAIFFWVGVVMAAVAAVRPLLRRVRGGEPATRTELASGFLLLWWLAGISPGFLSVPAASLGHTLMAQSPTFLLAALPLAALRDGTWAYKPLGDWARRTLNLPPVIASFLLAALLLITMAQRDWPAYFGTWASMGNVRLLYRADLGNVAAVVTAAPALRDFGVTSLLPGPWDREALRLELGNTAARPRLFNSERVVLYRPTQSFIGYPETLPVLNDAAYVRQPITAGGYELATITPPPLPTEPLVCFANGLCAETAVYDRTTGALDVVWRVARPLDLPPMPLISNPPPPGVDARPRLSVYAQLLTADEQWLAGDDGLWIDIQTVQEGDLFLQRHILHPPDGPEWATIRVGLYDPTTGERVAGELVISK